MKILLVLSKKNITKSKCKNKRYKNKYKKELPLNGWYGYILDVEANVQGKDINAKDILFLMENISL